MPPRRLPVVPLDVLGPLFGHHAPTPARVRIGRGCPVESVGVVATNSDRDPDHPERSSLQRQREPMCRLLVAGARPCRSALAVEHAAGRPTNLRHRMPETVTGCHRLRSPPAPTPTCDVEVPNWPPHVAGLPGACDQAWEHRAPRSASPRPLGCHLYPRCPGRIDTDESLAVGWGSPGLDGVLAIGGAVEVIPHGVQPDRGGDRHDEQDGSDDRPLPTLRHLDRLASPSHWRRGSADVSVLQPAPDEDGCYGYAQPHRDESGVVTPQGLGDERQRHHHENHAHETPVGDDAPEHLPEGHSFALSQPCRDRPAAMPVTARCATAATSQATRRSRPRRNRLSEQRTTQRR